jgi:protein required for attachment to host cells
MTRTSFPNKSLILVCDGAKALLFENAGDAQAINLKALEVFVEPHPPTRTMGSDRPTRVYDSMDGSRSGTEQTDWHTQAESDFLARVAKVLDQVVSELKPPHVVLVAPPRALGVLRQEMADATRATLSAEIGKDLVNHPVPEIESQLAAMREAN